MTTGSAPQLSRSSTGLSQEELHRQLDYNPDTGKFTWRIGPLAGREAGCHDHTTGYITIGLNGHYYKAHNLAWFYVHGEWKKLDHEDGTKCGNRIKNLRPSSQKQNNRNHPVRIDNLLGVKGVTKSGNKFVAIIFVDGHSIYLGTFATIEEAKDARREAANKYFGEFANED